MEIQGSIESSLPYGGTAPLLSLRVGITDACGRPTMTGRGHTTILRAIALACLQSAFWGTPMHAQPLDSPFPGGRVLARPQIVNLYWHTAWDSVVPTIFSRRAIDTALSSIVTSNYLNSA